MYGECVMKKNRILLSKDEAATIARRAFVEQLTKTPGIWSLLHRHVRSSRRRLSRERDQSFRTAM
jgi:hypothetical protein